MSLEAAQKMYLGAKVTGKVGFLAQEIDGLVVVVLLFSFLLLCACRASLFSEACFIAN